MLVSDAAESHLAPTGTLLSVLRGRPGLSPVMVGRASALAQLRDLFDSSAISAGDLPTVALIAGEAGIGKTRLVREFLASLPDDTVVLSAYGDPGAVNHSLAFLTDIVPAGSVDGPAGAVEAIRTRVATRRAVVVLEDLHWADADSTWVIDRLVTAPWSNVLVVGTYRPDDLSRRLPGGDLVSRLERRATVERVHLDRLNRSEVTAFLVAVYQDPPASAVIEALYNRTGGNPFFLEELLTCCDVSQASDLVSTPLPWSLEEVVQRQLDGLDPVERKVAEVAAICGPSSRFDVLAEVADLDEAQLIDVLRALIDRGLLIETGGERFVFRHALVRDAVEHALLGRQQRRLHERALEALRRADASTDELARHALGAGRFDEFVELARRGVEEFMDAGQTFAALRLADEALREEPDDESLLYSATRAAWLAGLLDEADDYATRWLRVTEPDPSAHAAAVRWAVRIAFDRRDPATELALVQRLEDLVEHVDDEQRCRALAWLAQNHMLHNRNLEAVEVADRAIEEAERIGDKGVAIQARIERGSALAMLHGVDGAAELLQAVDEAEAAGEWVLVTRGLNNVFDAVPISSLRGRDLLDRFRRAAERAGFDMMATSVAALRSADLAHADGDMETCRRLIEPLHQHWSFRRKEQDWLAWWSVFLAIEEGCTARAHEHMSTFGMTRASCAVPGRSHLLLQLAALENDRAAADDAWRQVAEDDPGNTVHSHREIVEIVDDLLRLGWTPAAVRTEVLDGWVGDRPAARHVESFTEGLLLAEEGRAAESAARLLTALSASESWLPRYQLEYLRAVAAAQVAATGDRTGARALAEQAVQGLAKWPGWRRDRAEALLRRLEGRSAGGDGLLSAREREVAVLLAEGLTNAEVARRLYISPKTAAVHVSNILMKLNMSSRAEVAAWAVRSGLVSSAL